MKKQVAELPNIVKQDEAYQNAMQHSDVQNARAESDRATTKAILDTMSSGIELYKAFMPMTPSANGSWTWCSMQLIQNRIPILQRQIQEHVMSQKSKESTSKLITLVLRHEPEEIGITLDEHG